MYFVVRELGIWIFRLRILSTNIISTVFFTVQIIYLRPILNIVQFNCSGVDIRSWYNKIRVASIQSLSPSFVGVRSPALTTYDTGAMADLWTVMLVFGLGFKAKMWHWPWPCDCNSSASASALALESPRPLVWLIPVVFLPNAMNFLLLSFQSASELV